MPDMANVTVKKYDGTTDQLWTAVQASGGDKSPAIWRNLSGGPAPAFQPEFRVTSRPNTDNSVRRVEGSVIWKQTATGTDGVIRVVNTALLKFEAVVPQSMTTADLNEYGAQATNLLASPLLKSAITSGFAPQ